MANDIEYTVPDLTTQGPEYAADVSEALTVIQNHDHDGVNNGATIDIAGQSCNADLSLEHHNLSNLRSIEFDSEPAKLTGSQDVLCLYVNQGNLGFNTSDGTFVPITAGDFLAPSALSNFLNFVMRANGVPVTADFSILNTDNYNLIAIDSSGGAITGTLPIAANIQPGAVGRLYIFRDASGAAVTHPITIQVAPASGNTFADDGSTSFVLNTKGGYVAIYTDGVNKWFTWTQNTYQGEVVAMNGGSTLQFDANSSIDILPGTGGIQNQALYLQSGGAFELQNSTNVMSGGTLALTASTAVTWSSSATCTFATGTTCTFQSGTAVDLAAGSTCTASGTLNLGGATVLSGTVNGTATYTALTLTGASLTLAGGFTSDISNSGMTHTAGEAFNVVAVSGNYTVDSSGTHFDRYLSLQLTASSSWTITLPSTPNAGRLLTIADGTGQDPGAAPGYSVTLDGNGNNILKFGLASTNGGTGGEAGGSAGSLVFDAPGTTLPAPGNVQGSGWAVTLIWTGSIWAIYDFTSTLATV